MDRTLVNPSEIDCLAHSYQCGIWAPEVWYWLASLTLGFLIATIFVVYRYKKRRLKSLKMLAFTLFSIALISGAIDALVLYWWRY